MFNLGTAVLAALGISFLIFIHELGHFLCGRLFDVRIETFSIGFGPKIFGFRRGETDYRVSIIPLGGYVKFAGEYGDFGDEATLDPRDLTAKPAWQRAIIFSGGVVVNFAFAFLIFPVVFALGVPFRAPIVGVVDAGSAAWRAGLLPGDNIVEVNGRRIYGFSDVTLEVALGDPDDTVVLIRRGADEMLVPLRPDRNEDEGRYEAGLYPADTGIVTVAETGPAYAAGLRTGDVLLEVDGHPVPTDGPASPTLLAARNRASTTTGSDLPAMLLVADREGQRIEVSVVPQAVVGDPDQRRLGVLPTTRKIGAARGAAQATGFPLRLGDVVTTIAGKDVFSGGEILEALRHAAPGAVDLHRRRGGEDLDLTLTAAQRATILAGDLVFTEDFSSAVVQVLPDSPAQRAGMTTGDEILALGERTLSRYDELKAFIGDMQQRLIAVRYRRGDIAVADVELGTTPGWDYGFTANGRYVTHREETLGGSFRAGFDQSINALRTTWLTLTKLFTGEVGGKNLGGIVSISVLSYHFAAYGMAKLLFFLGILSISLGFINILPIPVLDGGQIVYLLLEKVKGSRLSDRFLQYTQLGGLVLILALVLYVTYNDVMRIW